MKVLPKVLAQFAPELEQLTPELLAEQLTNLGFEADVLPGKTPVIDVSLTPNRADGMSHLGLARDLRAFLDTDGKRDVLSFAIDKPLDDIPSEDQPHFVFKPESVCSQYHVVRLKNVVIGPSPRWLCEELTLLGLRPINTVVDVTNYLMELYGAPLHAFDADALIGDILTVRETKVGETLTTLDGTTHTLPTGVVVIEDGKELVDLAGIRGGATSQIKPTTTRILLQSAIFDRARIRKVTNELNYRTTASARFERGVDPAISLSVLARAVELLTSKEFGGATVIGKQFVKTDRTKSASFDVDPTDIDRLLGFTTPLLQQKQALTRLGCIVTKATTGYTVTPPSWRVDLTIWQDAAEEIARLHGLNDNIPLEPLPHAPAVESTSLFEQAESLKDVFISLGLAEVQTYSFISAKDMEQFSLQSVGELANPLNPQLQYLRPSLMPGLAAVIATNGMIDPVEIFEVGHVFTPKGEQVNVAIGLAGNTKKLDAWMTALAEALSLDETTLRKHCVVTELQQKAKDAYKIRRKRVTLIEAPLESLLGLVTIPDTFQVSTDVATYKPLSKYPPIVRDVALLVLQSVSATQIASHIPTIDSRIESVDLFDEFQSDKFGPDTKGLAFHIYYADSSKTLTDTQANEIHSLVERSLIDSFEATIR